MFLDVKYSCLCWVSEVFLSLLSLSSIPVFVVYQSNLSISKRGKIIVMEKILSNPRTRQTQPSRITVKDAMSFYWYSCSHHTLYRLVWLQCWNNAGSIPDSLQGDRSNDVPMTYYWRINPMIQRHPREFRASDSTAGPSCTDQTAQLEEEDL